MIDIKRILTEPEKVKELLARKGCDADLGRIAELDEKRRALIVKGDELKKQRNEASALVPKLKKEGKDVSDIIARTKAIGEEISALDKEITAAERELNDAVSVLPNLPDEDLKPGGKENNEAIKVFGEKPSFDFKPLDHVTLCTKHGLIDYERGVKLSGSGHWIYRDRGALLEWALLNFFVSEHVKDGYEFILPPLALGYNCGYGSGQFPKFRDEVYWVENAEADGDRTKMKFMLPTAETALVNLYSGEVLKESELPKKLFAYTPCFRKEAGSYRSEERGMIRGHQFNKVEMVQITTPEQSDAAFEELVGKACSLVEKLGLHFRLSKLAAADCSASMARTYDIEVWIPSMGIYKEVSSVSNARDYQARRNSTRVKGADGKNRYVHTLNGSGLATSRVLPAIVEQYQQADGSIVVPEVLRKYVGFDVIK
ncbi:MAG TPA: serine--tRNA ligase [Candidatus Protoclostridium stercorigallinarum]|uniref:Serine--tRNA ligase n=1 Tax=Candidatus Protoclostridium stercorigallinarum TaxID=2838741 RepID=A0A9D1PZL3_9FIRM|nr:serine--tRNA ligase [Candidatus Protoclostridium stercorigallinarum]